MDDAIKGFFNVYVALFCLTIYVFTFAIRTVVDRALRGRPVLADLWSEVGVTILPIVIGAVCALVMKTYPYPALIVEKGIRLFFGVTMGFFSSWVYKFVRGTMDHLAFKKEIREDKNAADLKQP